VGNRKAMERAILKMGPLYYYKISVGGKLYVNRGDGNWVRLKYKNHKECPVVGDIP